MRDQHRIAPLLGAIPLISCAAFRVAGFRASPSGDMLLRSHALLRIKPDVPNYLPGFKQALQRPSRIGRAG